jgi:Fe-S-cluster containining protein
MTNKESCKICGHQCCRWLGFTHGDISGKALEFYLRRGCKILRGDLYEDGVKTDQSMYRIFVPHVCPHLIEGEGCSIYENRPLVCVEYSGKTDELMKEGCLLKEQPCDYRTPRVKIAQQSS